jgi:hypothetical protein
MTTKETHTGHSTRQEEKFYFYRRVQPQTKVWQAEHTERESAQLLPLSAPYPNGQVCFPNLPNLLTFVLGKVRVFQSSDIFTGQWESDFSRSPEDRGQGMISLIKQFEIRGSGVISSLWL